MQDTDHSREHQFQDASADSADINAPTQNSHYRGGRGRGRARFSRNWREDQGPRGEGSGYYRGGRGGRGGGGYQGEEAPAESSWGKEDGGENSNRFRDPYHDGGSFRPHRGRQGYHDGGFSRGRGGRGRGRGNYQEVAENGGGEADGENNQQPGDHAQEDGGNYYNHNDRRGYRGGDSERRYERGQRGRGYRSFNDGRGRGNSDYPKRDFSHANEDEDVSQNRGERGESGWDREAPQRRGFPSAAYSNKEEETHYREETNEEYPSKPAATQERKPQRRQRAPHLRSNCRNEDEVLALFECHHKQKGITLDNYGNIPVEMVPRDVDPVESFSELSVEPALAENIERCGYKSPTPVQRYGIPVALAGNDLMACAQTGSGKTAAFLIPIANYILVHGVSPAKKGVSHPIGLVLAPTRELALQIFDEVRKITFRTDIFGDVVYGGTPYPTRFENDILVACPGRLNDMFEKGLVSFSEIKFLVLDEADRMLEMGFEDQIELLVASRFTDMPPSDQRQTLMFSATFPQRILNLAKRYLRRQYYLLTVGRVGSTTKNITQVIEHIENVDKMDRLFNLICKHNKTDLVLVFVETKKAAEDLHRELSLANIPSATIHGDRRQQDRENALASFKNGKTPILVATDVASRGLDIPDVSHVIQYDLPSEMDDYTHRIGRTGRAGNKGVATCFYNKNNRKICIDLYKYFSEHDQHVPSWFKEEAEAIEGEAMLSRNTVGGNRGNKRRAADEDNQGTWGDRLAARPARNQAPKKKTVLADDGGF